MPSGPIKCAGAPQKIAYLAVDYWRKQGVLNDIDVHLVVPTPRLFGIPAIADSLDAIIADYGITVHTNSEVTSVDAAAHKVAVTSVGEGGTDTMLPYDVLHAVPRQSAPDWIKSSPLSTGDANGYVDIDKHTMQHVRYPNVFSLGDAGSSPNSKTGAAIRKQAPVVVDNIDAFLNDQPLRAAIQRVRVVPDRHVVARDAAGRVRLRPEPDAVVPAARPDQAAPGVLVPQEVRPAVHVLEPDAQGPGLAIRLRHNEKGHHNGNQESDLRRLRVHDHRQPHRACRLLGLLVRPVPGLRPGLRPVRAVAPRRRARQGRHRSRARLAAAVEIQSIPTVMAFRDGVLVYSQPGALPPAALEDLITQVKSLDMADVRAKIAARKAAATHNRIRPDSRTNHVLPREVPPLRKNRLGRLRPTCR